LDPHVLKLNNRGYQSEEMVQNAIQTIKRADFKHLNIDLILGLYGDTKEKLLKSFRKILEFKPYSISIYPLQPTKKYLQQCFNNDVAEFNTFWNNLADSCLNEFSSMAKKFGYVIPNFSKSFLNQLLPSCWSYLDSHIEELQNNYIAGFEQNVSVFGVGCKAESKIDGVIKYRRNRKYVEINKCSFSGWKRNHRTEMINFITESLSRDNLISLKEFQNQFKTNLTREFDHEIMLLSKLGVVNVDSNYLYFNAKNKNERFLYLSCFFSDEDIREYFNRISSSKKNKINLNRITNNLKDKYIFAEYKSLLKQIRSLQIEDMIDGFVSELRSGGAKIIDSKGSIFDILIPDDCLYTREYSKDNKPLFEELTTYKEIHKKNRRLVIFLKKNEPRTAVLIKYIHPLDSK